MPTSDLKDQRINIASALAGSFSSLSHPHSSSNIGGEIEKLRALTLLEEVLSKESHQSKIFNSYVTDELRQKHQDFVARYSIKIEGAYSVGFKVQGNQSALDLIKEAQALGPKVPGYNLVWPSRLEIFKTIPEFKLKLDKNCSYFVDACVKGSNNCNDREGFAELKLLNLQSPPDSLLAAAYCAFYIASSGRSLFAGNTVRTKNSSFYYGSGGFSQLDDTLEFIRSYGYQNVYYAGYSTLK